MTDVSFEEEKGLPSAVAAAERPRGLTGTLMRMGIVGSVAQANVVLIIITVFMIAAAAYIFVTNQPKSHVPSAADLESVQKMQEAGR